MGAVSGKRGPDGHMPTDETRTLVRELVIAGCPQDHVATRLGITKPTLHKHYRPELDEGLWEANRTVATALYNKATNERDTACMIFWLKAKAGWREVPKPEESDAPTPVKVEIKVVDARRPERADS